MENNKIKVLDCTLRDGGYYNNWDFDEVIVDRYLRSIEAAAVDVVELGFRLLPSNSFRGPFAYTTDDFIDQLNLPEGPIYGVMINAKELIDNEKDNKELINSLFNHKDASKISLVRIAINFDDIIKVKSIAKELMSLGYIVGLNMMQAQGKDEKDYFETAKIISEWNTVDVLYFADSIGNMLPEDVKNICKILKKAWKGNLGIHTHNNKNLALINTMTAVESGVTWCDSTITGMGRGAGNVTTESLLLELSRLKLYKGNANMTQPTVEDFTLIKRNYGWGPNLYYHYASNHGIHPTFVQSLLNDRRYDNQQVMGALEFLADRNSTAYSVNAVREAIYGDQKNILGEWNPSGWLNNKEALIVGAGPSIQKYKKGILQYIDQNNPAVLFLNINRYISNSIGLATVVSHETRALFDSQEYKNINHPIILPKARLGKLIDDRLDNLEILDYGLALEEGSFSIEPKGCRLQWPLAAAYAFSIATQAQASKISLVGFDGYDADDPRQEEMNNVFQRYKKIKGSLIITSLTPTTYRINQSSIFSPLV
jgi:4-hydroxy 2-oxovalerate aldolase